MKFFVTVILVAIVSSSYGAHIGSNVDEVLLGLVEEKCNSNTHNNVAFRDLMNGVDSFPHCVRRAMGIPPPHPLNDYNTFCALAGTGDYYMCVDNLTTKVAPCLDEDEAYLPAFVLTSFNASYDKFCGKNGAERVNVMENDIHTSDCLKSYFSSDIMQSKCIHDLHIYKNLENEIFTLKKDDLCSDLRSVRGCAIQFMKDSCNEDHTETIDFFINPYLAAC